MGKIDKLEAKYKIVTLLFMAGADKEMAELRLPSIKGVLRYWYRAIALSDYKDWGEVQAAEEDLFGSSEKGQGKFWMRLEVADGDIKKEAAGKSWPDLGSAYLGYGAIGWDKKARNVITSRAYIKPRATFTVTLSLKTTIKEQEIKYLQRALKILGLCGGLGARSRRGFGSVNLVSLKYKSEELWLNPTNTEELRESIIKCLSGNDGNLNLFDGLPQYSAFSQKSKIVIATVNSIDALKVLDETGKEMVMFRSFGRKHGNERVVLGKKITKPIFKFDHDLIWDASQGIDPGNQHPRRGMFGLPHNYFFMSSKVKVDVTAQKYERRASPLYIHIHELAGEYVAVLTVLPAVFLPVGEKIIIAAKNRKQYSVAVDTGDFKVLEQFLARFDNRLEVL